MLRPVKITIEYEGGTRLVIGSASAAGFIKWLRDSLWARWIPNTNNFDKALIQTGAKIVFPDGTDRPFTEKDTVI